MRSYGIAFALLSLGLLSGCTAGTLAPKAVEAAPQPKAPQHSVNRYELHGSPDKLALLVDSETGTIWQYDPKSATPSFKMIAVNGLNPEVTVAYKDGKKIYDIPTGKQVAFLTDHPNAKRL